MRPFLTEGSQSKHMLPSIESRLLVASSLILNQQPTSPDKMAHVKKKYESLVAKQLAESNYGEMSDPNFVRSRA
jgi:hypothetical protein